MAEGTAGQAEEIVGEVRNEERVETVDGHRVAEGTAGQVEEIRTSERVDTGDRVTE